MRRSGAGKASARTGGERHHLGYEKHEEIAHLRPGAQGALLKARAMSTWPGPGTRSRSHSNA